jgi:hypothetical protein
MTRLVMPAAVLLAAVASWLSQATLAISSPDGARIALVPISLPSLLLVAFAGIAVIGARRAGLSLTPLWLLALLILPWLPFRTPSAFLLWSGSIRWFVWGAVALLMLATAGARLRRLLAPTSSGAVVVNRPRLLAGVLAFAIFGVSAWQVSPMLPGGDEPHYLVITQSLLRDHDLKIENNHRRGDYREYYPGALAPHFVERGRDGEIYSIHAPGLPALVAPAFALAGYRGVVLCLLVLSACGSALAWHLAYLATGRPSAAWFGWAAVTWSATTIFHSFMVYPDGPGGVVGLTGVWALFRAEQERRSAAARVLPWLLHGAALAMLPWMHSRLALLAGSIGALVLLRLARTKNPVGKAVAFLSVPAASALCWIGFFLAVYGKPDPSAPYGATGDFSLAFVPGGLSGLLFDQRFGLIANAPVLIFGVAGLAALMSRGGGPDPTSTPDRDGLVPADRRFAWELLFVVVPYLVTASSYAMWWAGLSAPARFASPVVYLFAIPCAVAWAEARHRATRAMASAALALSAFLSLVLVLTDGGRLAYNTREATALWLDWASRTTALGEGLPIWHRGREGVFARDVAVYLAAFALAWVLARALASSPSLRDRTRYGTALAGLIAVTAMSALTAVWALHGASGISSAPSQLEIMHRLATDAHVMAIQVAPPRRLEPRGLLARLRLESSPRAGAGPRIGRNDQPIASFPAIPAGRYRLFVQTGGVGGWVLIGINQDQFALRTEALGDPPAPIEIDFPVDVRALIVRGDDDARRAIRSVAVEPVALVPAGERLTERVARRAVRHGAASIFFLDTGCFSEPETFWIGGARQCTFVLQRHAPASSVRLALRNAPVDNHLSLESGQWRDELTLAPGEERQVEIPLAPGRQAALVTASSRSGFRPSETIPDSRDGRLLGVQVKVQD